MTYPTHLISLSPLLNMVPGRKSQSKNKWLCCWPLPEFNSREISLRKKLDKKNSKMVLQSAKIRALSKTLLPAISIQQISCTSLAVSIIGNLKCFNFWTKNLNSKYPKSTYRKSDIRNQNFHNYQSSRPWHNPTWRPVLKSGKSKTSK